MVVAVVVVVVVGIVQLLLVVMITTSRHLAIIAPVSYTHLTLPTNREV